MTSSNDQIVLYGGQGDIFASLQLPSADMRYLMLETAEYGIWFGSTSKYTYVPEWTVLRLHAFGSGGDLLVRRDENHAFWRFVGYEGIFKQLGLNGGTLCRETLSIGKEDEHSLLWGAYDGQDDSGQHYWQENRVGKAQLAYPFAKPVERVEIRACRVYNAETQEILAYWTYTLVEHQSQENL